MVCAAGIMIDLAIMIVTEKEAPANKDEGRDRNAEKDDRRSGIEDDGEKKHRFRWLIPLWAKPGTPLSSLLIP